MENFDAGSFRSGWIQRCRRGSHLIVALVSAAAVASVVYSTRIRVDGNLEALLPSGSRTIKALEETKRRFGSADLFTVSIVSPDPYEVARVQDEVRSEMVRDWPFVRTAQIGRDQTFFRHHALLFLPPPQLDRIEEHLRRLGDDLRKGPLGMDLLSDAAASDTFWLDADAVERLGLPPEATSEFLGLLDNGARDTSSNPKTGVPEPLRSRLIGKLPDGKFVGLVQGVLSRPSSDIGFVNDVHARSTKLFARVSARHGKGLEIGVEGPYNDLRQVDSLLENGTIATVVSVLLTLLIMTFVFRRFGLIALVVSQAAISCAFTLAFATMVYGRLNLYTIFVIAILFGMGTDYSFYVIGYAQRRVRAGESWETALARTFTDLSGSLLIAWATTVAGLLVLLQSNFPGFHEFGLIASVGITTSLVLTWIFLPAAVFSAQRLSAFAHLGWLAPSIAPPWKQLSRRPWMERIPGLCALVAALGAVCILPYASRLAFEYDFVQLEDTGTGWARTCVADFRRAFSAGGDRAGNLARRTLPVKEALGSGPASSQPAILLAQDPAVMDRIHDTLAHRKGVEHDTLLAGFLTLRSFLPAALDQAARSSHLRRIDSLIRDPLFDRATGKDSQMVASLRDMAQATPYALSDLPSWALDLLRERDGSVGRVGLVYNNIVTADSREAEKFERRYGHMEGFGGPVTSFSSNFIYADLVRVVRDDSWRMTWTMALVLCGLLVLVFRRWRPILVCFLGMAVSLALMLGTMGAFGIRMNAFNLIVITTLQAALTDVVIYLVLAWERQGRRKVLDLYSEMGTLVCVAVGTTISGYAGMLFTTHLGIRSIGSFAVVGLVFCVAGSLAVVPWLCSKLLPPDISQLQTRTNRPKLRPVRRNPSGTDPLGAVPSDTRRRIR